MPPGIALPPLIAGSYLAKENLIVSRCHPFRPRGDPCDSPERRPVLIAPGRHDYQRATRRAYERDTLAWMDADRSQRVNRDHGTCLGDGRLREITGLAMTASGAVSQSKA